MDDLESLQSHKRLRASFRTLSTEPAELLVNDLNHVVNYASVIDRLDLSLDVHERVHFSGQLGERHSGVFLDEGTSPEKATAFPYEEYCDRVVQVLNEEGIQHQVIKRNAPCPVEDWEEEDITFALIEVDLTQEKLAEKLRHAMIRCVALREAAVLQNCLDDLTTEDRATLVASFSEGFGLHKA